MGGDDSSFGLLAEVHCGGDVLMVRSWEDVVSRSSCCPLNLRLSEGRDVLLRAGDSGGTGCLPLDSVKSSELKLQSRELVSCC